MTGLLADGRHLLADARDLLADNARLLADNLQLLAIDKIYGGWASDTGAWSKISGG